MAARQGSSVRVGCAGWTLPPGCAERFPGEGSHLERYARVFSCVEINSSFHRSHQAKTYARWADSVPDAFRFSVKIPRAITRERRLHGAPDMYYSAYDDRFLEAVATQMRLAHQRSKQVWCIFDNTARGQAVPNALNLMELLRPPVSSG